MTNSFKGRQWHLTTSDDTAAAALMAGGMGELEAQIMAGRGLNAKDMADFLDPKLKNFIPNPAFFKDMDIAADRLLNAILEGEKIAIWSDYDVDGATSAAILGRFLKEAGTDFVLHIPDRITEGYGPNAEGLAKMAEDGVELVCVLDAGTTAFEPLEAAEKMGLDVIVIDHHMAEETLPPAVAVVNPNRLDQAQGYGHVCAAGMTFMFAVAVNLRLRQNGRTGIDLMPLVGIVALGTICDVVSLTGINRAFVARGLPILSERNFPGVAALANVAGIDDDISVSHCGFGLGPRINAGGRIGDSTLGAKLLLTESTSEAEGIASHLDALNKERQEMEKEATKSALEQLDGKLTSGTSREIAIAVVEAHEGIIGISAARVKEAFDTPSIVLAPGDGGLLKGSGRSVPGFDLGAAVVAARQEGLLVKGGGHGMAAGLSLHPDNLEAFTSFMNTRIRESEYAQTGVILKADAEVTAGLLQVEIVEELERLGPFGMGNPTPKVVLKGVRVCEVRILKDKHLKMRLQDPSGKGPRLDAPLWNSVGTPFGAQIQDIDGKIVDVFCAMEINEWNGRRSVQLKVEDVRLSVDVVEDDLVPF